MKRTILVFGAAILLASPAFAKPAITGDYVEARTAEVFAGGCVMSSEADTAGRQAVLAWHVRSGALDGVRLDGLSVVAALAGDRNLGIPEIGGVASHTVNAVVIVDSRATAAQAAALVDMVRHSVRSGIGTVAAVERAPISFERDGERLTVTAGTLASLSAEPTDTMHKACGEEQWFSPLSRIEDEQIAQVDVHAFQGDGLGVRWSDPRKKSAFIGTFAY